MGINTLYSQGVSYTDGANKANILNQQFASVFTKENQSSYPHMGGDPLPDIPYH